MTADSREEMLETAFGRAESGDADAFAEWMAIAEHPLRRSLARFARAVDVEVVVQETFLRMWLVACDDTRRLEGGNASLKFALGVARNVAHEELRKTRLFQFVDEVPEPVSVPNLPDPALRKAINECMGRLPEKPRTALNARVQDGHLPDRDLAAGARMKLNTFLQNIVRARKLMAECLEKRGVRLEEVMP